MELNDILELRYPDGRVVTRVHHHSGRRLHQGELVESDDAKWEMYDRLDRGGITVYLCRPAA